MDTIYPEDTLKIHSRFKLGAKAIAASMLFASTVGFAGSASAAYPDHAIRMIVGFSAGGTTDVVARILGKEMSEALGQPVVVENRPGAGSNIATEMVSRAKPDGYTLYMVAVTAAINQTLYKNLRFDLVEDFTPVALGVRVPNVLVVNPEVPVKSVKELVEYAKANPGKLNFASSGSGTSIHMAGELFKQLTGLDLIHVPFNGANPAMMSTIGNHTPVSFISLPAAAAYIKDGRLRALATTGSARSESFTDIPTMAEAGLSDQVSYFMQGILLPARTSRVLVDQWYRELQRVMALADVRQRVLSLGLEPVVNTPDEFAAQIRIEVSRWSKVISQARIALSE
jgi:tripartite-type tricarboxylate transporter receptor subunit TctC